MFEWHPAMVWARCFWDNFRKETEKQQASRIMKHITSEWDEGREVSRGDIDRLEFLLWVIRAEQQLSEYENKDV